MKERTKLKVKVYLLVSSIFVAGFLTGIHACARANR